MSRSSVSDGAFVQLRDEILSGRLGADVPLPSERKLTEVFGVNRQAVREAMKRLDQAGLVEIQHGGTTRVRDFRRSAGLDLLPHLLMRDGEVDIAVARSVMEMRACIGPDAARLCAIRVVPTVAERLADIVARMAQVTNDPDDPDDPDDRVLANLGELDWEMWELIVDGADNIAYRLAFNALRRTASPLDELLLPLRVGELTNTANRRVLAAAITGGRADRAEAAARKLLTLGSSELASALSADDRKTLRPTRRSASRSAVR